MTRIAAIHALGDIWAMGAEPQAATATLILPRQSEALQSRLLAEIMTTARDTLHKAGAEIVGGHTSLGDELTIGFTLTGLCENKPITLQGAKPGDALILTKPIGSGTILAAEMQMKTRGDWIADAYLHMTQDQSKASQILQDAHAMTDVTGFGLAGHLLNICEASHTAATLSLKDIPALKGARTLAKTGIRSTLYPKNRALLPISPKHPTRISSSTPRPPVACSPPSPQKKPAPFSSSSRPPATPPPSSARSPAAPPGSHSTDRLFLLPEILRGESVSADGAAPPPKRPHIHTIPCFSRKFRLTG